MAKVSFTHALKRFYPDLGPVTVEGKNMAEILDAINQRFPGLKDYLVDDQGRLRQHVNIFIGENLIKDKTDFLDPVGERDEVYIFQALSGG